MKTKTLKITVNKIRKIEKSETLKAFVDVSFNDAFLIKSLKVVEGKNGLFVSMPQSKATNQENEEYYFSTAIPLNKEVYAAVQKEVLDAYATA